MAKTKKRPVPFGRMLAGWALFLALLGGVLLALLWGALERYELSTPEHAILTLVQTARTGSDEALAQAAGYTPQGAATLESWAGAVRTALAEIPQDRDRLAFVKGDKQGDAVGYALAVDGKVTARFTLTPEGDGWRAAPALETLPDYTVTAPAGVEVSVNGVPLTGGEDSPAAGFEDMGDAAPRVMRWTVSGLYDAPQVTATSSGAECPVVRDDEKHTVTAGLPVDEAGQAEASQFLETAAKQYAQFISEDVSFTQLARILYPDTSLYKGLKGYYVGWYVNHTGVRFDDLKIQNVVAAGPDAWTGDVSFTFVVTKPGLEDRKYPSRYHMAVVRTGGDWKLVSLDVGAQEEAK